MCIRDSLCTGSLSPNFYKNSHFDISKYYVLLDEDIKHISDPENYFVNLASDIRQTPDAFAHREVHYLTINNCGNYPYQYQCHQPDNDRYDAYAQSTQYRKPAPVPGGAQVSFASIISGYYFCDLLAHGREMDQVIARNDASLLQHSTPELERWFDKPPAELPRQNGFPLAFVLLFFLLPFAADLLVLLAAMPGLTPPEGAALYFIPAILFTFANLTATYLISRGKTAGLAWYGWMHQALTCLTTLLFLRSALAGETHHAVMGLTGLLLLLLCRIVLNGRGFILFVLYARTQRIAALARMQRTKL